MTPLEIGGDIATSELPEQYAGPAKMLYEGHRGTHATVFPSQEIANRVAGIAIRPDMGGYYNVRIVRPEPNEAVTCDCPHSWYLG